MAQKKAVELKVGGRVYYVTREKNGGKPTLAEITALNGEVLDLRTVSTPVLEERGVIYYPAAEQAKRTRTNTWHHVQEGDDVAAEAKAKAEADAKAKEGKGKDKGGE